MAGQHITAGQLAQHQAAPLEFVVLAQSLERGRDLMQVRAGGLGELGGGHRLARQEKEGFKRRFERHAETRSCATGACTVTSPNGSLWAHVSSPCL